VETPGLDPRSRGVEERVRDLLVVHGLEEAVEADLVVVRAIMGVVLDGGDPAHHALAVPGQEILGLGVLKEGVLFSGEKRPDVHPELRHPERVAAVKIVRKCNEPLEIAPVFHGRDSNRSQMTPSSFPSSAKMPRARSICSGVWVAIRLVRSRHWDGGTAGGTTGLVNTPASNSFRQKRKVFSRGPMSTGTMGVSVGPMSKPRDRSPSCRCRVFFHSEVRRSGSCCSTCRAARTPAVLAGGRAAVEIM